MTQPTTPPPPAETPAPKRRRPQPETSSTKEAEPKKPERTIPELLIELRDRIAESNEMLGDLCGLAAASPIQPAEVHPGENDLTLVYDFRMYSASGEIAVLKGSVDFPESLHPDALPALLPRFRRVFLDQVGEPMAVRLMRWMNHRVANVPQLETTETQATPNGGFFNAKLPE